VARKPPNSAGEVDVIVARASFRWYLVSFGCSRGILHDVPFYGDVTLFNTTDVRVFSTLPNDGGRRKLSLASRTPFIPSYII